MTGRPLADTFTIRFRKSEARLSRGQLERAPESLLSVALLSRDVCLGSETLTIPSSASSGEEPTFTPSWDGTEDAFKVCMTCYIEDADQKLKEGLCKVLPACVLVNALDFFNIPAKLWPPGARLNKKLLQEQDNYHCQLRKAVLTAVEIMEEQAEAAAKGSSVIHFTVRFREVGPIEGRSWHCMVLSCSI
ncbi:hypothetical protein WJX73_008817 [Symbiochloris irregularis]|uniref:Uncharacterized protein n=1 Tax=Symbiochloris irregularis TaxID=706552 RepID=A0AAW1PVF4_9CHLO